MALRPAVPAPRKFPAKQLRGPLRRHRDPGEDRPVQQGDDLTVIKIVRECKKEAHQARISRLRKSKLNMDAYMGYQDFGDKIEGQSTETLPKLAVAAEQLSAFVKRALTQFGKWFEFELGARIKGKIPLKESDVETIVEHFLKKLPDGRNKTTSIAVRLGDAIKIGALESLMIFKVYGTVKNEKAFHVEIGTSFELKEQEDGTFEVPEGLPMGGIRPELVVSEREKWCLHVDLIKTEDFYPDPTGAGMYEIHEVERDLAYVQELADQGVYDKAAVNALKVSVQRKEEERRRPGYMGQDRSDPPGFRKKVVLTEYWGDLLGTDGRIAKKNITCTVANDQFLIRKPVDNPFWHSTSPFVVCPLIRVPWSVWHKAIYDIASSLNRTINEVFNLILDGGLAAVWGIKQLRAGFLEKPEQISGGIPQGKTLIVSDDMPVNVKVLEEVSTGKIPPEAGVLLQLLDREFFSAAMSNELQAGLFPGRKVLATEVNQVEQGQAMTMDSIAGDMERECIEKILEKCWLLILQNMSILDEAEIESKIGKRATMWLMETPPEERFAALAMNGSFTVSGLTSVLSKARDFQKLAALMQMCMTNPILLQAFIKRFSGEKMLTSAMKMLNLNPRDLEKSEEELAQAPQELQNAIAMGAGQGQGQSSGMSAENTGEASLPAEINQAGNPLTGLSAS